MLLQQRQQELSATLGSRGQSMGAFSGLHAGAMGQPTGLEKFMQYGKDAANIYSLGQGKKKKGA